jgi:hypothetical protein
LIAQLNEHILTVARFAHGKNRKQTLKYIRKLSSSLTRLENTLAERDNNTDAILESRLGAHLGEILGNNAFEQLIGESPGYYASTRFKLGEMGSSDEDYHRAWDKDALEHRINLAEAYTPQILRQLSKYLNRPLLRLLGIERRNPGGTPAKRYRNFMVRELGSIHRKIYNRK